MSVIPKILIVDDDPRMCESLTALLSNQHYVLKSCNSGSKAKEYLSNDYFDLVLLDIFIPDMNGYQIIDYINEKNYDTLVIVISGHTSIESAIKFIKKGAYDCIRKPFEPEKLLITIKNGLDHKRLKSENEIISEKLIRTENRYRYLVQNSPDIIYMLDSQGNFQFISDAVERLLGFPTDQLIGKHYTTITHKDDFEKAKWTFNERRTGDRATSQKELRLSVCYQNGRHRACNGRYLTFELKSNGIYGHPFKKMEKIFIGTHGVIRDISGRKLLESKLKQAYKLEAIGTLSGGIAHEFNNILGVILGNAQLALTDVPPDNPAHHNLEEVEKASLRARDVVMQLLSYLRKVDYQKKLMRAVPIVEETIKFLRSTIPSGIDICQNMQATTDTILADPTQIHQLMLNLGTNAAHAMEDDRGVLKIEIINVKLGQESVYIDPDLVPGNYVKIAVSDTGQGISPEIIEYIFDPFFTTKDVGKGTGMGLSVVQGIVKTHKGAIKVNSELGRGTTFSVYFPVAQNKVVNNAGPIEELLTGNETILFIDDEVLMVNIAKQILERLGYVVETKTNPVDALELFRSNPSRFDLVISDMAMPQMNGDKLVKELLAIRSEMPIVLCTGFSEKVSAENANKLGIRAFAMKPLAVDDFARVVRNALDAGPQFQRAC